MIRLALTGFWIVAIPLAGLAQTPAPSTTTAPASLTTSGVPSAIPTAKRDSSFLGKVKEAVGLDHVKTPALDQLKGQADQGREFVTETLPDLGLKIREYNKEKTEKRRKKKKEKSEYEGIPIAEAYVKFGSGDRTIIEKFHVLKEYRQPSPYVREIYWFDPKGQRVTPSLIKDKEIAQILHGPYKRYQNGHLIEEGFYYIGAKDGRWERYDINFQLLDKAKYARGFPAESQIVYYDSAHTRIKEILPREYGQLHGTYLAYHETGQLAAEGRYDHGVKVGRWTEYYPLRRQRKKITQYGRDRWEADVEPYVISEWDEKGKLVYERPKEKAVVEEDQ